MTEMQEESDKIDHSLIEEFGFDTLKKKKKNKKVSFNSDNESLNEDGNVSGDEVKIVSDGDAEVDEMTNMFASLKKKKKQTVNFGQGDEDDLKELEENDGKDFLNEAFDSNEGMKKKKKKMNMEVFDMALNDSNVKGDSEAMASSFNGGEKDSQGCLKTDRDYTYAELLSQIFKILRQNNPELAGEKKRYTIVPPTIYREGNKKTIFANVIDISKRMHRNSEHVIQFLFAELGTSGSVDGSARLVIKGKFQQKQIENVLKRYIVEYVTCKICKSPDTLLTKENRIYFMTCESCGSKRSVSAIKTGFRAQTEKRKR
ncbi:hypothetical protein PNEG_02008 [Pneumocystis murina B123]|uniref:Translation initiation factor IF2/IF5 domain-containing protein n=1 Tax=Pneumocystis murina (strain B123) TaxID=1069680 RepID=M7NRD9_PNEMU|nr:hypothetical protein PNEG_02008 [Pneumocystis murina B123]EMR09827.1 hypothetical protein PNEG_02008 [Pneumocystis murina B123]